MNEQNTPQPNKHIWIIIIVVLITAIIVGGGVYAWQRSSLQATEQSLQQQITAFQNQITNFQKPTQPIVTTPKKTQAPTQPADENASWKTYENKEIGLSFRYPAGYGDFQISIRNGETGKKFVGNFQDNKYFPLVELPQTIQLVGLATF